MLNRNKYILCNANVELHFYLINSFFCGNGGFALTQKNRMELGLRISKALLIVGLNLHLVFMSFFIIRAINA